VEPGRALPRKCLFSTRVDPTLLKELCGTYPRKHLFIHLLEDADEFNGENAPKYVSPQAQTM
jgi:hypothetical protein